MANSSYQTKIRLHTFPVELVRIIFEIAAQESCCTAASLCRVSKSVRKWITPLVYHSVVLETALALKAFHSTLSIPQTRLTCHIRMLHLPFASLGLVTPHFLRNFPALECLAVNSIWLQHPSPSTSEWLSPRPYSITVTGSLKRISYDHPIFRSCTHLYLPDDVPVPFALTAGTFPHLTHLACGYRHGTSSTSAFTSLPLLLAQKASEYFIPDSPEQHYMVPWGGAQVAPPPPRRSLPVELEILIVDMYLHDGKSDTGMFVMERLGLGKTAGECSLRADPRFIIRPGEPLSARSWAKNVASGDIWSSAEEEVRSLVNRSKDEA
ncbi:hypothetical protein M422DRAFT_24644 [Sphaerobolus stellatus SS14]|nr:hypothetical protein M422DRAFT_24644 [Sphaerobolus stellatus SS14]